MAFPCVYVVAVGSTSGLAFRGIVYWLLFLYSVFQDPNVFITVVHSVCIFVGGASSLLSVGLCSS